MGAENDALLLAQVPDEGPDVQNLDGVQAYGGLVQNDHLRVSQQSLGNADALPVSLGQSPDAFILDGFRAGLCQSVLHLFSQVLAPQALGFAYKVQILPGTLLHIHRGLLRQIANAFFCLFGFLQNVEASNGDFSLGGGQAAGEHIQCGGFARAVGAQEAVNARVPNFKGQILHRVGLAIPFGQVFHLNHIVPPRQGSSPMIWKQ